jgi:hypothetical protein
MRVCMSVTCVNFLLEFMYVKFFMCGVAVAERFMACPVFASSEAGIVGSNPTQGMDVYCLCVCVFLCLCTGRGLAAS